ncbi:MAG: tetratricopeptide repeat protein, partial [Gemmatimonadota bacterium]
LGRKSGCLSITDRSSLGYIFFEQGRISYATVVNRRDRLGDILSKSGRISAQQLEEAIQLQEADRDKKLGEILVETGAISRAELEQYIRIQIEEAVYFLFSWRRGAFTFESDVKPHRQEFLFAIDPEALLLEGARRVDEWSLIEKKIPAFDIVFKLDESHLKSAEVSLTDEQKAIIPLLDGTRDVTTIVEESTLVEFEVGKALYGLITAGFVHRVGRSDAAEKTEATNVRVDEHRNLGIAFYRTGMLEESIREFRRVVELRPSDGSTYFYIGLIHFRQAQWPQAIEFFKSAAERGGSRPAVLYDLALSYEKNEQPDEAEAAYAEAATRARRDPRILTGWGVAALRRGDYEVAAGRLDRAREVAGEDKLSAIWYWGRSLAAAGLEQYREAEAILREGVAAYPEHSVLRNNLGALLELLGNVDEAVELLQAALADEPSLPQLSKNLGDLHYRAARYDDAWDAYQRAVKLQPELGDDVYFKLGNIAYKRLDRELASELWRRTLEVNPNHELALTNLETVSALK